MKRVLAVSGGVDSVVMLDLLMKQWKNDGTIYHGMNIVVAHFDHGIRDNSQEDADFVQKLAREYGLNFVKERAELGGQASEAVAREARYEFLHKVAGMNGEIYVAQHLDDLIETVLINFLRGTGWRGLTGMNRPGVRRPLLENEVMFEPMDKAAIIEYAAKRGLRFREDQSNSSDEYLRNRIRHEMNILGYEDKLKIFKLWQRQRELRDEIDHLVQGLLPDREWERGWFKRLTADEWDEKVALELLRAGTLRAGISATRPQLEDFRQAILNYQSGKQFNLPGDRLVKFSRDEFVI